MYDLVTCFVSFISFENWFKASNNDVKGHMHSFGIKPLIKNYFTLSGTIPFTWECLVERERECLGPSLVRFAHSTGTSTLSPSLFALPRFGGCATFREIFFQLSLYFPNKCILSHYVRFFFGFFVKQHI